MGPVEVVSFGIMVFSFSRLGVAGGLGLGRYRLAGGARPVCDIDPQYIGTATGLMLTLAAVGGFFIPIIFGHLVPRSSFDTGWVFLAVVSFAFALLGLTGRNPAAVTDRPGAGLLAPAGIRAALPSPEVAEN